MRKERGEEGGLWKRSLALECSSEKVMARPMVRPRAKAATRGSYTGQGGPALPSGHWLEAAWGQQRLWRVSKVPKAQ